MSNHHSQGSLGERDVRAAVRHLVAAWATKYGTLTTDDELHFQFSDQAWINPYLAEAAVIRRGDDFVLEQWGTALNRLCGGHQLGKRISTLPQPARSHLRRICVRATLSNAPALSRATWALEGMIWRCTILAVPTSGDEMSATRLLVALLYEPHPAFLNDTAPEGLGWPAAIPRAGVHAFRAPARTELPTRLPVWASITTAFRRISRNTSL